MLNKPSGLSKPMHWALFLAALALISLACNFSVNLAPTAPPLPTDPPPPAPQEQAAQPAVLPTYTPYPTYTIPPPSQTPLSSETPSPTLQQPTATQTRGAKPAFTEITKDSAAFSCGGNPSKITISALVSNPDEVYYITLFYKLTEKVTKKETTYQTENLSHKGDDKWSLTLPAASVANPNHWVDTWFTYQLVLQVKETKELIRSDYFTDISFVPCP